MKVKNRSNIWKQQKYNNSCAWDCFSMLLATQGVETSTWELVGSSHVPYQIILKLEENLLKAGMLVQSDRNVSAVLRKYGYHLVSVRMPSIADYIAFAKETLLGGNAFITNVNRPGNLPGRHASVFTEFSNSCFRGLDPDCRLDRTKNYCFSDVQEVVALDYTEDEFVGAVAGKEGFVPLLGILTPCDSHSFDEILLRDIFKSSNKTLDFYRLATSNLDFSTKESMPVIYSVLKPVLSDLRTAIEIRDEYLNQESEIALFLKVFEKDILKFRKLVVSGEVVSGEMQNRLHEFLKKSYLVLEEHLSFDLYSRNIKV